MDRRLVRIAAVLAVPLAVAVGVMEYQERSDASAMQAASGHETVAVLQEDAAPGEQVDTAIPPPVQLVAVAVTWESSVGTRHDGTMVVEAGMPAGTELSVWVDSQGKLMPPPWTVAENAVASLGPALRTWFMMTALVVGALWAIRTIRDRMRCDVWDAEWAEVEPEWSRRDGGPSSPSTQR